METPDNEAGLLTEQIMMQIKYHLHDREASTYNRVWSIVYDTLSKQLPERRPLKVADLRALRMTEFQR